MKLNCSVLVVYRSQSTVGIPRKRAQNSSLNFMLNPKDDKEAYLIHQTVKCNGVKYKITGNIENVFTKFLSQGKATIRLKAPAVDLCIECDSLQLKCFLQKLKAIIQGQDAKTLKLMTVSSSTQVPQKPKTKLVIVKKENYDVLCQFPRTLETVQINNIGVSRVDSRILKLCNLRILNLERNAIEWLPEALGSLQICELYLGSNFLGKNFHPSHWKWMTGHAIKNSLALLSLEKNQLQYLPKDIVKLRNLVTLKLDNNILKEVPVTIGKLSKLRYLTVSCNKLSWLPSTLCRIRLEHIDLSHNEPPELSDLASQYKREDFFNILSLRDVAALSVLRDRLQYSIRDGDVPVTLHDFINETSDCHCGKPTFCSWPFGFMPLSTLYWGRNIHHIVSTRSIRLFKFNYCSYSCYEIHIPL